MNRQDLRKLAKQTWSKWEIRTYPRLGPGNGESWADDCFVNNKYSVQISRLYLDRIGWMDHLWIRRHDGKMTNSWSELQRIKNELTHSERTAVQVYPKESQLVDEANMAHLWVYPENYNLPFRLLGSQIEEFDK